MPFSSRGILMMPGLRFHLENLTLPFNRHCERSDEAISKCWRSIKRLLRCARNDCSGPSLAAKQISMSGSLVSKMAFRLSQSVGLQQEGSQVHVRGCVVRLAIDRSLELLSPRGGVARLGYCVWNWVLGDSRENMLLELCRGLAVTPDQLFRRAGGGLG